MIQQYGLVTVKRSRFSQIVEACPYEFTANGRIAVESRKFLIGQSALSRFIQVVRRNMEFARKVFSAGTHGGAAFAGKSGQMFVSFFVEEFSVEMRTAINTGCIVHPMYVNL